MCGLINDVLHLVGYVYYLGDPDDDPEPLLVVRIYPAFRDWIGT